MEFKGTKGNWIVQCIDISDYKSLSVGSLSENTVVAHCYLPNYNIQQEQKANALLISKAPQLLYELKNKYNYLEEIAMLLHAEYWTEDFRSKWNNEMSQLEQLIKSATEL